MAVVKVNVTVDLEDDQKLKCDSLDILKVIRPDWTASEINWRVFTDGITNKLVGAWSGSDKTDTVLIRVYGCGTEKIIDRNMEMENMIKYRKLGSGSQLYAIFNNGICYEFLHGDLLSQATCLQSDVYRSVARGMARLHSVPIDTCKPVMWDRLRQFIGVCSPNCRPRLQAEWWTRDELQEEAGQLQKMLQNNPSPVVFCHNDALFDNIVLQPNNNSVAFIDLEYGAPNYAAFDIANHFCEFAGSLGTLDYNRWMPSKEYQLSWIKEYVAERNGAEASDSEVESIYNSVTQFVLCAHLQWSIWSVIQAENSTLDFDFVDYAIQRKQEYKRWKKIVNQRLIITK